MPFATEVPLVGFRVAKEVMAGGAGEARVAVDLLRRPPVDSVERV
jgi:hypothetical protein